MSTLGPETGCAHGRFTQLWMHADKLHDTRGWKMEQVRQKQRWGRGLREKVAGEKEVS